MRGPVNVIPREIFGVPIVTLSILLGQLPPPVADRLNAYILCIAVGGYAQLGLRQAKVGPLTQIAQMGRIPLIDVGTMQLIREGHVTVHPSVERFTSRGVRFVDGRDVLFDAVILATGFRPALEDYLADAGRVLDQSGIPRSHRAQSTLPGLYFCGFNVVSRCRAVYSD